MVTFDILRGYFHTETDEGVIMFLEEVLAKLTVKLSPKI